MELVGGQDGEEGEEAGDGEGQGKQVGLLALAGTDADLLGRGVGGHAGVVELVFNISSHLAEGDIPVHEEQSIILILAEAHVGVGPDGPSQVEDHGQHQPDDLEDQASDGCGQERVLLCARNARAQWFRAIIGPI